MAILAENTHSFLYRRRCLRVNGDNYFFDPNFGMYKLGNVEFISFIGNHLTAIYADLLDDFATYNVA